MIKNLKKKKGFTLIELIVVIAILAIIVLLAAPRFIGRTQEAIFTKHLSNSKVIQNASELYFMDEDDWPRLSNEAYTSSEIETYAEKILSITGEEMELDPDGNYYDIDYDALNDYVRVDASDKPHYILQNPVGKVYYLDGLSESGKNRVDFDSSGNEDDEIPDYYVQATDDDFRKIDGDWRYVGNDTHMIIPHVIGGEAVTSYRNMFRDTTVEGVVSDNPNIMDMYGMFWGSKATTLDLSSFDTANVTTMYAMFYQTQATTLDLSSFDTTKVTDMYGMFWGSKATTLDLSSFDTANVMNMGAMFRDSQAKTLDLSSFDTSNVTHMNSMFYQSQATTLDLNSFDTSNVTHMNSMFRDSQATTLDLNSFDTSNVTHMNSMFYHSRATTGFARTKTDANQFNNSSDKPSRLNFIVKP